MDPDQDLPVAPNLYVGRQVSWLSFNQRVIELARDLGAPDIEADARTNWDVGTSFGGVIVYVTADLTPVDSTCSAGGKAWLAAIKAALDTEYAKCSLRGKLP